MPCTYSTRYYVIIGLDKNVEGITEFNLFLCNVSDTKSGCIMFQLPSTEAMPTMNTIYVCIMQNITIAGRET